ncbi:MAG: DUF2062 domain-containing protein [Fibrobacterota bacterium]
MADNNNSKEHSTETGAPRICVIIPTYNNADRLGFVIEGVLRYCSSVIVVNDGSTDNTEEIIRKFPKISAILLGENRGKGCALRAGLHMAMSEGYTHAITIDADGQHLPEDIPLFVSALHKEPQTLWVGNRVLPVDGEKQPGRSRFGRRFGNFWYKFNTSISIHDTQCGFRVYPLDQLQQLKLKGERYEFEQDVLIRAAWNGTTVKELDIHLFYEPASSRVSHFRPVKDFLRISKINAKAGFIRVVFPVMSFEVPGDSLKEKILHLIKHELKAHASPLKAALSLALGVFMGIFPIHGLQVITLMGLATLLRLNRPLSFLGVCVSSPPFLPIIIIAAVAIGRFVLPSSMISVDASVTGGAVLQSAAEFFVGSIILACICSAVTFLSAFPLFRKINDYRIARSKG